MSLPIGDTREDGTKNLIAALQVAAAKDDNGDPMIQEVVIAFQDYIVRGCRSQAIPSVKSIAVHDRQLHRPWRWGGMWAVHKLRVPNGTLACG